jgi:NAD(P)-dependent dehydrogenase (short-subunit alcohol dehydrogenase family)
MRLKNKLAVITAAASGMGRAGVELFAREGATVAAVDINAAALKAVASDANAKGGKVIPIVSDLSTIDGVRQSVGEAAAALGGVDVMWAHAGTPGTAVLPATTQRLCCSCGAYFSIAASSENDHGNMNFASNTAPVASTRPSSVAPIQCTAGWRICR